MTILIFDAIPSGSAPLRAALQALGHEVEVTNNPAWPLSRHSLCIVWIDSDIQHGAGLIREVRASHHGRLPILAAASSAVAFPIPSAIEAGADDFLPFPADPAQLATRLLVLAARAAARPGLPPGRLSDRLTQVHSYEILAGIIGRVAHDYNNLLSAIQGNAELGLLGSQLDPSTRYCLDQIHASAGKAINLTRQLQAFSRSRSGTQEALPLDLSTLVRDSAELLAVAVSRTCRLHYDLAPGLPLISGDAARLRQALAILAINSSEALGPDGGSITFRVYPDPGSVVLEVQDSGPGISAELRHRIFDPFFSTKEPGRGLGLAAFQAIARVHGAALEVLDGPGALFRVTFPAVAASVPPPAEPHGTVLLIDEDDSTRAAAHRQLRKDGYVVFETSSAAEGLELMGSISAALDAVVFDPGPAILDPQAVLPEILRLRPGIHLVLWSACAEETLRLRLASFPGFAYAAKPGAAALAEALARQPIPPPAPAP